MPNSLPEGPTPGLPTGSPVEAARARFDRALLAGQRPRIEDYLAGFEGPERTDLLRDLLLREIRHRLGSGEKPAREQYRERFPLAADLIEEALATEKSLFSVDSAACATPPVAKAEARAAVPADSAAGANGTGRDTVREEDGKSVGPPEEDEPTPPFHIGSYLVEAVIGEGSFGRVYRARDELLQFPVAIKVPHRRMVTSVEDVEAYLNEARIVAGLDHPNIVPVLTASGTERFPFFVVSKLIAGTTLARRLQEGRPTPAEAARLAAAVAEALHHAHLKGVVHRDVKPGNILLDASGKPFLTDFGLALREEEFGRGAVFAGTVPYMSPEQARGEGHRVDGRSDVFSLGVVFYEMLVGTRPFRGENKREIREQIATVEPRPPRQVDDHIPEELERICLKALSKPAAQRYTTARDMAEDLRCFLEEPRRPPAPAAPPPSSAATLPESTDSSAARPPARQQSVKVVPKGLRSFDAGDTDFFLELLPGPRDRDGLPESLRFWKSRVEETDADKTFFVGLLYGPSGCGKSSLVKAGLLPRLAGHVTPLYVEATAGDTETRLLRGIRKAFPGVPAERGLAASVAALRRGRGLEQGKKLLIVLDQFEQWLHARRGEENSELVRALRQCDGGRVQCLVLIRDDFWMAATRFLQELEVRLVEGENSAAVDLFGVRHAKKVLTLFGRAFGTLPGRSAGPSAEQTRFLDRAVDGLAVDGKIIPVRLAVFVEMVKGSEWLPATLKEVGGPEGVGEAFLERAFGASATPGRRTHQRAARAVLKALLPEQGTDIRGALRSHAELLRASGYADQPREFENLIQILDRELRLVTPSDPTGTDSESSRTRAAAEGPFYQLTHDFLVPSVRGWLNRKQKESMSGRAELRLAELSELWNSRPENRQLPSWWEWIRIRALTRKRNWTLPQQKLMRRAVRYHASRGAILAVTLVLAGWGAWEILERFRARLLVDKLLSVSTKDVPAVVNDMAAYRSRVDPLLRQSLDRARADNDNDSQKTLHLSLALLPDDPDGQLSYLLDRLLEAGPREFTTIRTLLSPFAGGLTERIRAMLADPGVDRDRRFRAACALAEYAPDDARWDRIADEVVDRLVGENPLVLAEWKDSLNPVGDRLLPSLGRLLEYGGDGQRSTAARLYQAYARGTPDAFARLEDGLTAGGGTSEEPAAKLVRAKRQANLASALVAMGHWEKVWPFLRHSEDPTVRGYLIEKLGPGGADPRELESRIRPETEASIRRSLMLALGSFTQDRLPQSERERLAPAFLRTYASDPDPGVHAAAEWVLHRWGKAREVREVDERERAAARVVAGRGWYVNREGQTYVLLSDPDRYRVRPAAGGPEVRVEYGFAIASKEVTLEDFQKFCKDSRWDGDRAAADCPVNQVSWFDAVSYCNWLSGRDGIPKEQWCYEPIEGRYANGMKLAKGFPRLAGYRLPVGAEWELAARAGTATRWSCGEGDEALVLQYGWLNHNSQEDLSSQPRRSPVGMLKPNDLGLFDVHGNVAEWCHDTDGRRQAVGKGPSPASAPTSTVSNKDGRIARGGMFYASPTQATSATYYAAPPYSKIDHLGFRPVRGLP